MASGNTYGRSIDRPVSAELARTDSGVARAVVAHRAAVATAPTQAEHAAREIYSDAAPTLRAAELLNAIDSLAEQDRARACEWILTRAARIEARKRGEDPSAIAPVDLAKIEDLRAAIARAAQYLHAQDGQNATAARWLRDYKASDHVARYADHPDQNGALISVSGRTHVRGSRRMGQPIAGSPRPPACTLADAHRRASASVCEDLRILIRKHDRARSRSARRAIQGKIKAILYQWRHDEIVRETARSCGWRSV